ncbi:hypothetical protein SAR03_03760 [Staphylococcus arlettae]|uniref:Uncharacterized protein n=1 Tax=Staphylococcus arlettae TaxID=29378 RepID=A0ABQ0XRB5_9STAP|nr:hypothetical protein SAR03_03760 [Staphylococcus arlettae]
MAAIILRVKELTNHECVADTQSKLNFSKRLILIIKTYYKSASPSLKARAFYIADICPIYYHYTVNKCLTTTS